MLSTSVVQAVPAEEVRCSHYVPQQLSACAPQTGLAQAYVNTTNCLLESVDCRKAGVLVFVAAAGAASRPGQS